MTSVFVFYAISDSLIYLYTLTAGLFKSKKPKLTFKFYEDILFEIFFKLRPRFISPSLLVECK